MKNYIKIFFILLLTGLILASCDSNDDGFYNEKYVDIPDLVSIHEVDNEAGNFIFVTTSFSRYQNEPGQTTPLDLYSSTNGAASFDFNYFIEKRIAADQWEVVEIRSNMINVELGTAESGFFVIAHATYENQSYNYRAGIQLPSAGEYRLSFGINSDSVDDVEFRSASIGNSLFLNINSDSHFLNSEGYYLFTTN
ncbi:MAG TPA: hypothetical protein VF581_07135 [Flavobacterium sp.]|jgi:hypothetical protein